MRTPKKNLIAYALTMSMTSIAFSQAPAPPSNLVAKDAPNDAGEAVELQWTLSFNDPLSPLAGETQSEDQNVIVVSYIIQRKTISDSDGQPVEVENPDTTQNSNKWATIGEPAAGDTELTDRTVEVNWTYAYRIASVDTNQSKSAWLETQVDAKPLMQWFNTYRGWLAVFTVIFSGLVAYFINVARTGRKLWVRKIAGLSAIDEAVGRATEMGRPVLFVAGIQDISEIQTLAGLTVLSRVAKTAAEYGAQIEVPTCRSLVMAAARETVEAAYLAAGAPDSYQPDRIHYLTDEQFAFVAGVTGYMVREEPAACIYMGGFYAESLILAETGNHIGAIQVAGTAMPSQLPFFVASCDYTLIGEEFFAASAYLSDDPLQIGSLKGQDWGKFLSVVVLIVGLFIATVAALPGMPEEGVWTEARDFMKQNLLGKDGFLPVETELQDSEGDHS